MIDENQKYKILLVDDESELLEQARIFLEKESGQFEIEAASSAKKALKMLDDSKYDAIVSDYQIWEMDGLEFLDTVRNEKNDDIPFIIFTGRGREEVAIKALNLGANRYIQKGSDPTSQYRVLAEACIDEIKHVKSQKRLEESEKRFRKFFNHIPIMGFIIGENSNVVEVNDNFCKRTGYEKQEIEGKAIENLTDVLSEDFIDKALRNFRRFIEGHELEPYNINYYTKDGTERMAKIHTVPYQGEGGNFTGALGIARDITEEKRMKNTLERSKKKFQKFFDKNPDPVVLIGEDRKFKEVNEKASENIGYKKETIIGTDFSESPFLEGETKKKALEKFKKLFRGKSVDPYQIKFETKNGDTRYGEINTLLLKTGENERGALAVIRDITERRKATDRKEFLTSLLRHDVRNKAQTVAGYLELLKEFDLPEEAEEYVENSAKGIKDNMELIEKVRTLQSISNEESLDEVNIKSFIQKAINERESQIKEKGIEIELEVNSSKVLGGSLLKELFSNLIENSIEHSDGDKIRIKTQEKEDEFLVTVEDNGKGVSIEDRNKIFERGFKSGDTGGSGLGLHLVKQIIESYDGRIKVKDSEMGGARFDIYLRNSKNLKRSK